MPHANVVSYPHKPVPVTLDLSGFSNTETFSPHIGGYALEHYSIAGIGIACSVHLFCLNLLLQNAETLCADFNL